MNDKKRLSICMANYNHGHYLEKRLEGILGQLGENDELVFVDDASTDNSVEIVTKFASADNRIRLYLNPQNMGVIKTTNYSVELARGQYIATMASDDFILQGFVEKTMAVLTNHPEIGVCSSNCAVSYVGYPDKNPDEIFDHPLIEGVKGIQIFPADSIVEIFRTTNFWIPGHAAILKRELFLKYGALDEVLGPRCDWMLLHRIALKEGAAYIPEALAVIRQIPSSYSKQFKEKEVDRVLLQRVTEKKLLPWRKSFSQSCLLRQAVKNNFIWILFRPKYWDFLCHLALNYVHKRAKFMKNKISFSF